MTALRPMWSFAGTAAMCARRICTSCAPRPSLTSSTPAERSAPAAASVRGRSATRWARRPASSSSDTHTKRLPPSRGSLRLSKNLVAFAPAGAKKVQSFSSATCASKKILLRLQVWNLCAGGAQIMRAADCTPPCQKVTLFDSRQTPAIVREPVLRCGAGQNAPLRRKKQKYGSQDAPGML